MRKLLIGTSNPSKYAAMVRYLQGLDVTPVSPAELDVRIDTAEDDRTAEGNARQKALAWHRASGLPVLTEDSGLVLLDLPLDHSDQPGVWVRRAPGYEMTDEEMVAWYTALARRHGGRIRAAWQDAWCLMADENTFVTYADRVEELQPWGFWLMDRLVHTEVQPGWPLERIIIRSGTSAASREQGRERLRNWLKENIGILL